MLYNVRIKKWEQNHNYFAKICLYDSETEFEYLIKSKTKNDFNEKIYQILKNCLVMTN